MAGGGEGLAIPERTKRGKIVRRKKKRRIGFRIDLTPLVDITFLLLTFFMFTTTMLKPQIMEMRIPPEMYAKVEVRASELLTLLLTKENKLYWFKGIADETNKPQEIPISKLRMLAYEKNLEPMVKNKLITVLKISPEASYSKVIEILDELNLAEIPITEAISKELDEKGEPVKRQRKFTIAPLLEEDLKFIEGEGK
ncbi:MAG: biopolymer transporter ExbD [Ignavibacteria bacterium]|nr:biopolymer transporter ExbD [Ignavibacteria bacterium]